MARPTLKDLTTFQLLGRLQAMLANASLGQRSVSDDTQYPKLRRILQSRDVAVPDLVQAHPSIDSVLGFLGRYPTKQQRAEFVRSDFTGPLEAAEKDPREKFDPEVWTGVRAPKARLKAVRTLIPLAQASVEGLISSLGQPGANGGPILDERAAAIEHLRQLHSALGAVLSAADSGDLEDQLGAGLAAEVARYAKRSAKSLRDDPVPYVASSLILGILTACGLPGIGGYLAGVSLHVRKQAKN